MILNTIRPVYYHYNIPGTKDLVNPESTLIQRHNVDRVKIVCRTGKLNTSRKCVILQDVKQIISSDGIKYVIEITLPYFKALGFQYKILNK